MKAVCEKDSRLAACPSAWTRHEEKVSPFVSAVMILGAVGAMAVGKMKS